MLLVSIENKQIPSLFIPASKHRVKRQLRHWFRWVLSTGQLPSPWFLHTYWRFRRIERLKKPAHLDKQKKRKLSSALCSRHSITEMDKTMSKAPTLTRIRVVENERERDKESVQIRCKCMYSIHTRRKRRCRSVCLRNCRDKLYREHQWGFDLDEREREVFEDRSNQRIYLTSSSFVDVRSLIKLNSEMDRPLFVKQRKEGENERARENDKKSNHHSEQSAHKESIHWVVFDMYVCIYVSFSLFFSFVVDVGSWHSRTRERERERKREKRRQVDSYWLDWKEKKSIQSENTIHLYETFFSTPHRSLRLSPFFLAIHRPKLLTHLSTETEREREKLKSRQGDFS